jgi:hypothetical protein
MQPDLTFFMHHVLMISRCIGPLVQIFRLQSKWSTLLEHTTEIHRRRHMYKAQVRPESATTSKVPEVSDDEYHSLLACCTPGYQQMTRCSRKTSVGIPKLRRAKAIYMQRYCFSYKAARWPSCHFTVSHDGV